MYLYNMYIILILILKYYMYNKYTTVVDAGTINYDLHQYLRA